MNRALDNWPELERALTMLAPVTAPADPFEPNGAFPLNDTTLPDEPLVRKFREGIEHLKARNRGDQR